MLVNFHYIIQTIGLRLILHIKLYSIAVTISAECFYLFKSMLLASDARLGTITSATLLTFFWSILRPLKPSLPPVCSHVGSVSELPATGLSITLSPAAVTQW